MCRMFALPTSILSEPHSAGACGRTSLAALAILLALVPAHASVGLSCVAKDATLSVELRGAVGRSIGSGIGNFGGEAEIRLKAIPDDAREPKFETRHLSQIWFEARELRLAVRWVKDDPGPSPEIILIIKTRRGKAEEAPYRGRYRLMIFLPGGDGKPREAHGRITCTTD